MKAILYVCFIASSLTAYSQDISIIQGDLGVLRGQNDIKLQFDYDDIAIAKGSTEKEYKAKKIEYLNKKEAGRGDKWERLWNQYRTEHYEPLFKEVFIKYSKFNIDMENAPYTLIFKAKRFDDMALLVPPDKEPNPTNKLAFLDAEAWIVETKNPANVLAKISMIKVPGRDAYLAAGSYASSTMANYDVRVRLSFTYAKSGKELGIFIAEKLGK